MAPESIQSRAFSTASDVWSFGILQWEMFYPDRVPYQNMESMECAVNVARGCRLHLPRKSPPVVRRVMKACWQHNPVKRPSFLLISTLLSTKVVFGQWLCVANVRVCVLVTQYTCSNFPDRTLSVATSPRVPPGEKHEFLWLTGTDQWDCEISNCYIALSFFLQMISFKVVLNPVFMRSTNLEVHADRLWVRG